MAPAPVDLKIDRRAVLTRPPARNVTDSRKTSWKGDAVDRDVALLEAVTMPAHRETNGYRLIERAVFFHHSDDFGENKAKAPRRQIAPRHPALDLRRYQRQPLMLHFPTPWGWDYRRKDSMKSS